MKLYKVLINGKACHGGNLSWSLPTKSGKIYKPGKWHSVTEPIQVCKTGLHLTTKPMNWFKMGCDIYEAEAKGKQDWEEDKVAVESARLIKPISKPKWMTNAEKFINDLKESKFWFKPDGKPLKEWKYFEGATWGAAWGAAWDAARGAARGAAWDAARGAAWDAAWDAARDAARGAAWDAARDAAWDAARDAAWGAGLYCSTNYVCTGLKIDPKHKEYVDRRWQAWKKGYAVLCDVDGVLYVYGIKKS